MKFGYCIIAHLFTNTSIVPMPYSKSQSSMESVYQCLNSGGHPNLNKHRDTYSIGTRLVVHVDRLTGFW